MFTICCTQYDRLLASYCRSCLCNAVHCGARVLCRGLKLSRRPIPGIMAYTVVFIGQHFLFTSSDTFAARCFDVCRRFSRSLCRLAVKHSDRLKRWQASKTDLSLKLKICWSRLFHTTICSFTVRRMCDYHSNSWMFLFYFSNVFVYRKKLTNYSSCQVDALYKSTFVTFLYLSEKKINQFIWIKNGTVADEIHICAKCVY